MTQITRVGRRGPPRRQKYNAKKTVIDGLTFASKLEAGRYRELKLLVQAGQISDLILQPKFVLQDGFTDRYGKRQRPIAYIADFQYVEEGQEVIEDTKGFRNNAVWMIKKKMFLKQYPQYDFRIIE